MPTKEEIISNIYYDLESGYSSIKNKCIIKCSFTKAIMTLYFHHCHQPLPSYHL